ncbi:MAG TPA: TlpA disulfide reductase family protein [Anaeromyxobacter sp.]|nr:TlpA disulfide reductase family protein [Anaeromyxobacter sp.]
MRVLAGFLAVAAVIAGASAPRRARAETERGTSVDDARMRTLDGGTASLFEKGSAASVLVLFRPAHDRSVEALRAMGECQAALSGKAVRFVGIVSDRDPAAEVRDALAAAGTKLPVLVDEGDALYAKLGVRAHPAIFVLDRARKIVAQEAYRQVGLCDVVKAHIRRALGELSEADHAKALAPAQSQLPGEDPTGVAMRHVKFGRKLLAAGSVAMAHDNARKSLALAPTAAAWVLEGDAFKAEGKCADAVKAYDAALRLDRADAAALAGRQACPP